ncbi:MAG TPA: hypothetical protein DCP20_06380 [Coriobacteriia bacterium]|nr:hypothetical protein [Coriobacteriia bacterium]
MSVVREILVARHPETVANRELRFVGSGDSPYTRRGAQQRDALAAHIASWAPAALYVSPLPRARAVAEVVDPAGALTTVLDDLRELDFGEAEGLTWEEIEARGIPITRLGPGPVARGGEAVEVFGERVARASAAIVDGHGRTAVVTHAGVMRRLLTLWLDLPPEAGWRLHIPNAVVAVVRFTGDHAALAELRPPAE